MVKELLKKIIPPETVFQFRKIKGRLLHRGNKVYCPVCDYSSARFLKVTGRGRVICPVCRSMERHRLLYLYWKHSTELFNQPVKRLLHVAPEPGLFNLFRKDPCIDYYNVDLGSLWARVKAEITDLPFEDTSFDVIICNHVLEHVTDDRKALSEFFRVLVPGGWATLQVPIKRETTFEDPNVTTPEERLEVFGQDDHVRIYGKDYLDRLRDAGFKVESISATEFLNDKQISEMVLGGVEDIIID